MGKEGVEEDVVVGLFLVEPLCSSGSAGQSGARRLLHLGLQAYKAIVGFVEQPQVGLSSVMFKTCRFQIFSME